MIALKVTLIVLLFVLGELATYKDIKDGIIPNRWLGIFMTIGIVLDVIYYGFFARDVAGLFLLNLLTTSAVSFVLYFTHSLAGGDSKLIPVMSILYPAEMYLTYADTGVTLFIAICLAIFYGYLYMIIASGWKLLTGDNMVEKGYIKRYLQQYLKSYVVAFVYVTFINLFCTVIDEYVTGISSWIVWLLCILVAWASGKVQALRKHIVLIMVFLANIGFSVFLGVIPISINPQTYILTAVLMLCQMMILTDLYETISTARIKKGMILSTFSSMAMQKSRVQGLPGISTEDLRDRLTEEQAESVKRWGKTGRGMNEVSIVRKIPFAVFIAAGYVSYFIIWSVVL